MADDPLHAESKPPPNPNPNNLSHGFDSLAVPPLDPQFFASSDAGLAASNDAFISDLGLGFDDNCEFELTFDDLDHLYLPSETEDFLIPDAFDPAPFLNSASPESGGSTVSADVSGFLNYPPSESAGYHRDSPRNSPDRRSNISDVPSPESGNCHRDVSGGPVSSQGSGDCGGSSGVSEGCNSPSHSGNSDRDVSSNVVFADHHLEVKSEEEGIGKNCVFKRKKETEEGNAESRTTKSRRSSTPAEAANSQFSLNAANEDDDKRKARLMRNRESAQLSRQRKKHYVEELEDKVRCMHSTITDLNGKISYIMAENASLRQQLSGGAGMCPPPPPPPGMYPHHPPMVPMGYPWMPCTPYVVKPQGSQVPLVPIPRLKPQPTGSTSKVKKPEGSRKTEGKTKKVASISLLGLMFFVLLFGGLVPIVHVKFGGLMNRVPDGSGYVSERFYDLHRGEVLTVTGHMNGSVENGGVGMSKEKFDGSKRIHPERFGQKEAKGSDEFVRLGNKNEPLVASLYVPRNDKLVKIDGNLIIHSVLASEKGKTSQAHSEVKNKYALAIPKAGVNRGRRSPLYRNLPKRQRALTSGAADALKDHMKSTAADGKLQQWFREGLAGKYCACNFCADLRIKCIFFFTRNSFVIVHVFHYLVCLTLVSCAMV